MPQAIKSLPEFPDSNPHGWTTEYYREQDHHRNLIKPPVLDMVALVAVIPEIRQKLAAVKVVYDKCNH
jgi:hypothetical protein